MRTIAKTGIIATSFMVMAAVGVPALAFGVANPRANAQATETTTTATDQSMTTNSEATDAKTTRQTKLAATQLKACQNRERVITGILGRIATRGQKQLDLFSSIATKTEAFYTRKGKTLSNYDTLVANVATQKAAAQTAVTTVKTDSTTFSCTGTDPKGAAASFKTDLKSEIAALQAYRTAVKNLIVGVKSVQSTMTPTTSNTTGGN